MCAYLLVEDILAGNVRGDVTSDRVSNSIRTVGVKLSSRISLGLVVSVALDEEWIAKTYNVHGCTIPETVDLDVVRSLDKVGGGDGSIGNKSSISTIPRRFKDRLRQRTKWGWEKAIAEQSSYQSDNQDQDRLLSPIIATPLH